MLSPSQDLVCNFLCTEDKKAFKIGANQSTRFSETAKVVMDMFLSKMF